MLKEKRSNQNSYSMLVGMVVVRSAWWWKMVGGSLLLSVGMYEPSKDRWGLGRYTVGV